MEIEKAHLAGKSVILGMDANSKLGPDIIPNDNHNQTPNGKILAEIVETHGLIVVNSLSKCSGKITRRRNTEQRLEESTVDFVIISSDLEKHVQSMLIDEKRNHVLVRINKTKKGVTTVESDHNTIFTNFTLKWNKNTKVIRNEVFNLKNEKCQEKFKKLTTGNTYLSSIFDNEDDLNQLTGKFLRKLNKVIRKSGFKKIRITEKDDPEAEELFKKWRNLRSKTDQTSKDELKETEIKLANKAEENYKILKEQIGEMDSGEGGIHANKLWKLKKKLYPKANDPPTAMIDDKGNFVTAHEKVNELGLETIVNRLRNRPMKILHDHMLNPFTLPLQLFNSTQQTS